MQLFSFRYHGIWLGRSIACGLGFGHFLCFLEHGHHLYVLRSFLLAMSFEGQVECENVHSLLSLIGRTSGTEFCTQFHLKMSVIPNKFRYFRDDGFPCFLSHRITF